jgi:predicted phosphodiesterase
MPKIIAISDLHGYLPHYERFPEADILLIGGDITPIRFDRNLPQVRSWLKKQLLPWLEILPVKHIVAIAGNHDFYFETFPLHQDVQDDFPWTWLENTSVEIEDLKIYGIPQVPKLQGWAYYATDDRLRELYEAVPEDTDIVLSHGHPAVTVLIWPSIRPTQDVQPPMI